MPSGQALWRVVFMTKIPGAHTFKAMYHGICRECEEPIQPGDLCAYSEDDDIAHARDCNPYARRVEQRSATVCTTCFLTKPCECDE